MAESQLSHLPAIGGIKEMGRVELFNYKYITRKKRPATERGGVLEDLCTYVEDYFYPSRIAEKYQITLPLEKQFPIC